MNRYKVRFTTTGDSGDKWKAMTVTADTYYINGDGSLIFADTTGRYTRTFASGEWSRVRPVDAA